MDIELTSFLLSQGKPCSEAAWSDLRSPADVSRGMLFDCLMASTSDINGDLIRPLLRASRAQGPLARFQCRISHRPEAPSKVRLYKGLFGDVGRLSGATHREIGASSNQVVICGVWPLDGASAEIAPKGCSDHSTCCFVLSNSPLQASRLLDLLEASVVVKGVCSINYPDLAEFVCSEGHFILRSDPRNRQDAILLGQHGSLESMRRWVGVAFG